MIMLKGLGARSRDAVDGGFTLIETIITLVVLSIAAVGVLSVFTAGTTRSADPILISQATQLAQEKIDDVIALRKSGGFNAVISNPGGAFPPPFAAFAWNRTITCVAAANLNVPTGGPPPACASGYAHVTVSVTNAVIGTLTFDTLVANY